jgi:hypothetical protein
LSGWGAGTDPLVNKAEIVTGSLMVIFAGAMVVAMLLERRRVRQLTQDPSRVPADLHRRVAAGGPRRRGEEE